jgi:MFS family permease
LLGIVVGCSTVTKLGDVYGRKPVYLSGMVMNFLLIGGSLFLKNMLLAWVCLFLLGVSVTARYYVGYTYNLEMQPKRA